MSTRSFKLVIEVHRDKIFFDLTYATPPSQGSGPMGVLYPDGALYDLSFGQLAEMKSGIHFVELHEEAGLHRGTAPWLSKDESGIESVRFWAFSERVGAGSGATYAALQAFNPRTAASILEILDANQIEGLASWAEQARNWLNGGDRPTSLTSNGAVEIPEENLRALAESFPPQSRADVF